MIDEQTEKRRGSFWRELPILLGVAILVAVLVRAFVLQTFYIPSPSMEHTLDIYDRVLVNKLVYDFRSPHRGEIVVFEAPADWRSNPDGEDFIKRVIGVGGDTVSCKGSGPLRVNGKALNDTSFVYAGNTPCSVDDQGGQFTVKVPKGYIWVMGDHRQNSRDSRYNQSDKHNGMVPVSKVVGRAIVIAWPITRWDTLPIPDTFDQTGLDDKSSASAALTAAPNALALTGVVPVALWRRRRTAAAETRKASSEYSA